MSCLKIEIEIQNTFSKVTRHHHIHIPIDLNSTLFTFCRFESQRTTTCRLYHQDTHLVLVIECDKAEYWNQILILKLKYQKQPW